MEQDNNCLFKWINVRSSGPAGVCPRMLNEQAEPISGGFLFFSWELVKDGTGSGWLEKAKSCGYTIELESCGYRPA